MLHQEMEDGRYQIAVVALDELVPQDHLVRKIEKVIDFSFIYDLVKDLYSADQGRPSIDPVVLIKMVFIQYLFGIRSMRQTIREIETNVAYRWFLGYDFTRSIPHFSTFGKNYVRRFKDTDIFEQIFSQILKQTCRHNLVDPSVLFINATHVKANANKKKYIKQMVEQEPKRYQTEFEAELNRDRAMHGKKPLPQKSEAAVKEVKVSTTDPESGWFVRNEKEQTFAYSVHAACDRNGFILGTKVTGAHVHDSKMLLEVLKEVADSFGCPQAVAADAGYKTPHICKTLLVSRFAPLCPTPVHIRRTDSSGSMNTSMMSITIVISVRLIRC